MIERGAVAGKVFHTRRRRDALARATRAERRLAPAALARKELIRPDRAEFAGRGRVPFPPPPDPRRRVPGDAEGAASRPARALRRLARARRGERVAEYEEILGYHLEQAHRYRSRLGSAGRPPRALGNAAAGRLIRSAIELRATVATHRARDRSSNAPPTCPTAAFAPGRSSSSRESSSTSTTSRAASRPPGRRSRWPRRAGSCVRPTRQAHLRGGSWTDRPFVHARGDAV